jgi:hypothetical protein
LLLQKDEAAAAKGHALLISLGVGVLIIVAAGVAFFGYRMLLLRRQ